MDTIVPDPYDPQSLNRYTYCINNPLKYTDPSGYFLDTLFDVVSIVADVVDIVRNPTSGWGWGSLGADVVCAFVPFVAGGGTAVRGAKIGTKIVNRMDDASDAVKAVDRTHDYAKTVGMSWDVAKQAENTHDYAKTIDKAWDVTDDGLVTVRHYTDEAGKRAISQSGTLRKGTYVTRSTDIPSRAGHRQVEAMLEIGPSKGTYCIDVQVPTSRLGIPENGSFTSGGKWQRQLTTEIPIDSLGWRRVPGRPVGS